MSNSKPLIQRIEMKFQLDAMLSARVKDWARERLGVDENCKADGGDTYEINTLYLDTPELDLFHRTGVVGAAKHRIRRYGNEQTLWVETKRKKKMVVRKNRTAVFESDLMGRLELLTALGKRPGPVADGVRVLPSSAALHPDHWCGDWFFHRIARRRLQPAIQIGYRRFARTSTLDGKNLRLTIDSDMAAGPVDGWKVSGNTWSPVGSIADCEILELKFHNRMPALFKELLRTFPIPATGFSKYRTGMRCDRLHRGRFVATPTAEPSVAMEGVKYD